MPPRLDHRPLLQDSRLREWYDTAALRSKLTAEVNLRRLGLFLKLVRESPQGLVNLARTDPGALRRTLVTYAKRLQEKGRLPSYIAKTFVGVQSWLRFNGVAFDQFPKLRVVQGESIREERVPTQAELRQILSAFSARSRVVGLMMAHAGVRPGVLASMDASDGLRLGDLRELVLPPELRFEKVPFHVVVPARLSKTSVEYHTFGTAELADAIIAYLAERKARGERLSPSSPLITVDPMGAGTKLRERSRTGFITTPMMMRALRPGVKAILPNARTYVFRAYCSTQMVAARIDRDVREAILGHSLGVSGRYHLSKKLHPTMIEEMRAEYEKAIPFLESGRPTEDRTSVLKDILGALLRAQGVGEAQVADVLAGKVPEEALGKLLDSRRAQATTPAQVVVPLGEVGTRLAEGWQFIAPLGVDRAVLRVPPNGRNLPEPPVGQ